MPKNKPICDRCSHRTASVVITLAKPQGTVIQTFNVCDTCSTAVSFRLVNRELQVVEPKREPATFDMVAFAAQAAGLK